MILLDSGIYCQVYQTDEPESHFSSFWDFYSDNRLSTIASGRGYTGIAKLNDISGIILNPASLEIQEKFQLHLGYIYKNTIPWLKELANDIYLRQLHPTILVGASLRVNRSFQTGILFYTNNSYKLDLGKSYTYDEYGNVVDSFNSYDDLRISSYLIPINFRYSDMITLGINVIYSIYSLKDVLGVVGIPGNTATGKVNFSKFRFKLGVLIFPSENFAIGLTFLPETKETITKKWRNSGESFEEKFEPNIFPAKVGIGFCYKLSSFPISFSLDYNYSDDSRDYRLIDRRDFNFGLEYNISGSLNLKSGIFTQWDYRNGSTVEWIDRVGDYNQIFTTLGASYHLRLFTLDLSIMDSHLLSNGKIKQTYINSGLTYHYR
ncbi:MAG: hypothetical protein A2145_05660 [candidate division Zixibacteria bacterium RBG_16_40_9]|nr:MAG: hypothetical protein A2145_05660 [candidate division Zixibacteria bacterium RBG_16_40_9]